MTPDPDSPRTTGTDGHGKTVRLGERDSDGYFVGWIDEEGFPYESLLERDLAAAGARFDEAWREWNRSGGALGSEPDPRAFAERCCRDPANVEAAAEYARSQVDPDDPVTSFLNALRVEGWREIASLN